MKAATLVALVILCLNLNVPDAARAATSAYWRHEEGPGNSLIPDGPDTVLDSSGNGNNMQTFSSGFAPYTSATYTATVSPLALRSGLPNTLALDFGAGSNGTTPEGTEPNDDNYTVGGKPINTQLFASLTIEMAFNMKSVGAGQYQALFGKDGKPLGDAGGEPDSPVPPLKIMVRGDDFPGAVQNQLFIEWIDGDGDIHSLATGETVAINNWYHMAFTLSASDAELWVAGQTGSYALKDSLNGQDFASAAGGVLIEEPLGFSIGRGAYNNGPADWANALIDEVRVSDSILTSNQFLFQTVSAGNANFDGVGGVNGNDFLIWQRNVGRMGTGTQMLGDANGDTNVTNADLAVWRMQFGGPGGLQAVPEPTGLVTVLAALAALAVSGRVRGGC